MKIDESMKAKKRKRFARCVRAGFAVRQAVKVDNLRSRNAYRAAIGLPLVTLNDKHLMR